MWILVMMAVLLVGAYLLFRDTMNRLQYLQCLRLYWLTRNNGSSHDPRVSRAYMRQTAAPWWRGSGIQVRVGLYTFQIGVLRSKGKDLMDQIGGRDLDIDLQALRDWTRND